ncbi:MAG: glycoside hydrolase family 3 C-terminal domain-containing protein [Clostridiales bacterium]|jgi:beta-glucosidase|nr:glycoside hydrolase family 3 C-terminal domain-containing protein [Clostridiales bacterium]
MHRLNPTKHRKAAFAFVAVLLVCALAFTVPNAGLPASAAFVSEYGSKAEATAAGSALNERIAQEGMVLLKNEGNLLPLTTRKGTNSTKISVFGVKSVAPNGGGSAGEDLSAGTTRVSSDIYSSLKDANFIVNPVVEAQYRDWTSKMETVSQYPDFPEAGMVTRPKFDSDLKIMSAFEAEKAALRESYAAYGDAAVVVLSATGAGTAFNGRTVTDKTAYLSYNESSQKLDDPSEVLHAYSLDRAQFALLDEACGQFENVIVVVNTSKPIELGFLKDSTYSNIKAAILAGEPGENGFNALGQILCGQVNPSGRLVDTYANGFQNNPSWQNFGAYTKKDGVDEYLAAGNYLTQEGATRAEAGYVDYEEGVYVGYRYYETRGFTESDGGVWYGNNVVYPFGYGLSYTDFDWNIVKTSPEANENSPYTAITKDIAISVQVEVTNTGSRIGKDVVELYYTAPYTAGGIEKAHVVLGDFAKTKLLAPGESEILTLRLDASDMASYDWNDANSNSHKGYELEGGDYEIKLMRNAHDAEDSVIYTVASTVNITEAKATGNTVENRFDDVNTVVTNSSRTVLSRNNWTGTWPTTPTETERKIGDDEFAAWNVTGSGSAYLPAAYDTGKPWAEAVAPTFADAGTRPAEAAVMLADLAGKNFDDPLWEDLLDELTLEEAIELVNYGGYETRGVPYIGKPSTFDTDGPQGWTGTGVGGSSLTRFATAPVVASTWNTELAYELGKMIGEQGLWGNSDLGLGVKSYNGWYSPAMNTHRSPMDGRYTEYYSEDGVLAGLVAANTSLGARSKGAYVYMKHFALHEDGGTLRGAMFNTTDVGKTSGMSVWCDEQAMREVYFKPFQIMVEKGACIAAMSSFSRIGSTWAGGSYALLTQVLRDEWGFNGMVVTDIAIYTFCNPQQMVRAGGDFVLSAAGLGLVLPGVSLLNDAQSNTPTQLAAIRKAAKNILYVTVNSNAMQIPNGAAVRYTQKALPNGEVGAAYGNTVAATGFSGAAAQGFYWNTSYTGYSPLSFAVTAGALPEGLTLNASTGAIDGTPTAKGSYTFTVTVSASGYAPASAAFTVNVTMTAHTVTFNGNYAGSQNSAVSVDNGGTVAPIAPYRPGYFFTGWYGDAACETPYDFNTAVDGDKTLYAGWLQVKDGEQGEKGEKGDKGDAGAQGGGCGKAAAGLGAAAGLLLAVGAVMFVKKR